MLLEMGLIAAGIPAGWLLRRRRAAREGVDRILTWAVRILLFLLGLSLGTDAEFLSRIEELGLQAVVISTLCMAGCLTAAWWIGRFFSLREDASSDSSGSSAGEDRPPSGDPA